jgi:hypothetical protein
MLVFMAVVTTLATTPILQLLHRPGQDERLLNRSAS